MKEKKQRLTRKYNYVLTFVLLALFGSMLIYSREQGRTRDALVYPDSLDLAAARMNEKELTLRELAFYVAYEEAQVEEQALVYDSKQPEKYWNLKANGGFTSVNARNAAMQMALHDELFYQMAEDEIELTEEEEKALKAAEQDFWEDLSEYNGADKLGVTRDDLMEAMRRLTYAQKYQEIYAMMHNKDTGDYDFTSAAYLALLEEQDYEIYDKVWKRVSFGNVTLDH